ncbi:DUF1707 domain-containing protein [Sphaerisporangium sp. NPDC051011]|uniref:DUF1707 SHOCT-like domain-containing protein n=1 Tax=Sphaerisporangium sp. NPDC051011 TaxID=3155792 RepID=UPI003402791C
MNDPGGMRASDAEREAVVEHLRQASVEGRLTLAELTERTEAAYLAVTQAELAQVTADIPGSPAAPGPAPAPYPPYAAPAAPRSGRARRWYAAIMSETKRKGKWRVEDEIGAAAVMGEVTIDLREAEVRTNRIDIVATAVMGSVKIIVPDGVDVELEGVAIMGEKKVHVIEAPPGQNVPVVRVRAYVVMGEVKIIGDSRAKPIRRALAEWTEWWLERRAETRGDVQGMLRDMRGERHALHRSFHEARREQRREEQEARREWRREEQRARREERREWRDTRHDGPPYPPPPAEPPYPPRP